MTEKERAQAMKKARELAFDLMKQENPEAPVEKVHDFAFGFSETTSIAIWDGAATVTTRHNLNG